MRGVLISLLIIINQGAISQNLVKGIVFDPDGIEIPGVKILEIRTTNETESTQNGQFELTTVKDSSSVSFTWIGYEAQTIVVTSDTIVNVTLEIYKQVKIVQLKIKCK